MAKSESRNFSSETLSGFINIMFVAERKIEGNRWITECGQFIFNFVIISYNSKGSFSISPIQYLAVFHLPLSLYCHHCFTKFVVIKYIP